MVTHCQPQCPEFNWRLAAMRELAEQASHRGRSFIFIRIPEPLSPLARGQKYEDPLCAALAAAELGHVTAGRQQLPDQFSRGYSGLDIELSHHERGLALVRRLLADLGAPDETVIEVFWPDFETHGLKS